MRKVKELCNQWFEFESSWKERCDALDIPYIENPRNDNELLINYQHDFLYSELKDKKAEAQIWILSEKVCNNLIKKEMKSKDFFLDQESCEEKAGIATDYVCRRWKKYKNEHDEIYIIRNFIIQLQKAVEHALWHEEENDFLLDAATNFDVVENVVPDVVSQHEEEQRKKEEEQKKQQELEAYMKKIAEDFVLESD